MEPRCGDIVELNGIRGVICNVVEDEQNGFGELEEFGRCQIRWLNGDMTEHSRDEFYPDFVYVKVATFPDGTRIEWEVDDDNHDRFKRYFARLEKCFGKASVGFRDDTVHRGPCIVTPKRFVNVYLRDRAYGGPEEGGWWYDYLEPQEDMSHEFSSEEEAERFLEEAEAEAENENSQRRSNISSVLSEGCFEVYLEAWPAEPYPKNIPRYC